MNISLLSAKIVKAKLRTQMIITEFFPKWRDYGFKYAIYSSAYWLGWYIPQLRKLQWWGFRGKTNFLDNYLTSNFSSIVKKYEDANESEDKVEEYYIWCFWWQGYEQMPDLVKACYRKLKEREGNNVILLTNDNFQDYVEMPSYIIEKINSGKMTLTHFSDLLRVSLLAKYGGMWLDATCWVPNGIPSEYTNLSYVTPNTKGLTELAMWSNSKWCSWTFGTNKKNSILFSFTKDILLEFHKGDSYYIDYLFLDFIYFYAYHHFSIVKNEIDSIPEIAKERNQLWFLMNKPFNPKQYSELIDKCSIFKLSYKSLLLKEVDGAETFYGHLLRDSKCFSTIS